MTLVRTTISRLLSNLGSTREIELYLKRFSRLEAARFAVVRVGGEVLRDDAPALVSSLAFLQQVGLTPIVVHDAGPQIAEELAARGIREESGGETEAAVRISERWAVHRTVLQLENLRLVEALQQEGARAVSLPTGVFEAEPAAGGGAMSTGERAGAGDAILRSPGPGRVVRVRTAPIEVATAGGSIPVIAALGETARGRLLEVPVEEAVLELVRRLEPYKIVFLSAAGGLLDTRGKRIESIQLSSEYEAWMQEDRLDAETRTELRGIHELLTALPTASSVSITRPDELAKELFTHRGSGTLVRLGESVLRFSGWDAVDPERLTALIESSFGRRLREDYFRSVRPLRVYLSENYRAAMVLTEEDGLTYMDKFAVTERAQGEGLGSALWKVMREEHASLYWRSRRGNPINEFYFAQADGAVKDEVWTVFWVGIDDWATIRRAVEAARARPESLTP